MTTGDDDCGGGGGGGGDSRGGVETLRDLRSSYTMRTKCAISDAFVRDCVFAYCASVAQHVYSLSAEHCFSLRNNAISDERVRDCALSTHSVFRPVSGLRPSLAALLASPCDRSFAPELGRSSLLVAALCWSLAAFGEVV